MDEDIKEFEKLYSQIAEMVEVYRKFKQMAPVDLSQLSSEELGKVMFIEKMAEICSQSSKEALKEVGLDDAAFEEQLNQALNDPSYAITPRAKSFLEKTERLKEDTHELLAEAIPDEKNDETKKKKGKKKYKRLGHDSDWLPL
jgi:hypothetical protein